MIFTRLDRKDVLTCRLVNKSWCAAIESFLESFMAPAKDLPSRSPEEPYTGSPEPGGIDYKFGYFFRIPSRPNSRVIHDKHRSAIQARQDPSRNPFIGKFVGLELRFRNQGYSPAIQQSFQEFLDDFGENMGSLRLFSSSEDRPVSIPSRQYYPLVLQILSKCDNLTSFTLRNVQVQRGSSHIPAAHYSPPDHGQLECLQILKCDSKMLPIQDILVRKYSNQLVSLALYGWNRDLYHSLPWGRLRRLEVTGRKSDQLFDCLLKMKAPNLTELATRLDGRGSPQFKKFIQVLNHFPKLEAVQLRFSNGFPGFKFEDMIKKKGSKDPALRCPAVVSLEVAIKKPHEDYSINWLSCFPHLKRLRLSRPCVIMWQDDNYYVDEIEMVGDAAGVEPDFLELNKYIWAEESWAHPEASWEAVYKSSVWRVLPELEFLEIYKGRREWKYSRVGYNRFQEGLQSGK